MVIGGIHERNLENIAQIKFVYIRLIIYLIQEMAFVLYLFVSDESFSVLFKENERHVGSYFTLVAYFQQVVWSCGLTYLLITKICSIASFCSISDSLKVQGSYPFQNFVILLSVSGSFYV